MIAEINYAAELVCTFKTKSFNLITLTFFQEMGMTVYSYPDWRSNKL